MVADEPRAALVGRDVLVAGGSAADAAVAMYFAMSVTYPSSAGLGGGGVCIVRQPPRTKEEDPRTEALDFLGPASTAEAPGLMRVAVPGNVRGMYALHARYGRLRWSQLVRPAETLAEFGAHASRAFATELALGANRLSGDAARGMFRNAGGGLKTEGDRIVQPDLAAVLSRVRVKGALDFYNGDLALDVAAGAKAAGIALSVGDLRSFTPTWRDPLQFGAGPVEIYIPPVGGGKVVASLWKSLYADGGYSKAKADRRAVVITEAIAASLRQADADGTGPKVTDPAVASFAAMDGDGGAAACAVTLNGRFGTGRFVRGAGFAAAAPPGSPEDGRWALAPAVVASDHTATAFAVAAPSGDAAAPAAMVWTALRLFKDNSDLSGALSAARVFPAGGGAVYVEKRKNAPNLGAAGLRQLPVGSLGRVNVIYCPEGIPSKQNRCVFGADPRGYGYATDAIPLG